MAWEDIGVAMTLSKNIGYHLSFRRGLRMTIHHDIPIRLSGFSMVHIHKPGALFSKDLFRPDINLFTVARRSEHDRILSVGWSVRVLFSIREHIFLVEESYSPSDDAPWKINAREAGYPLLAPWGHQTLKCDYSCHRFPSNLHSIRVSLGQRQYSFQV